MTALRLDNISVVRDDGGDVPRLRIDLNGTAWITAKDLEGMALALADPAPQRERARQREERESTARATAEANRAREALERQATAARRADLDRLRTAFPAIADQLVGPGTGPAFFIYLVPEGHERTYFSFKGLHTSERSRAARFETVESAWTQVRALAPTPYAVEEAS